LVSLHEAEFAFKLEKLEENFASKLKSNISNKENTLPKTSQFESPS